MVGYDLGASSSEDIYKMTTKKHADSDALEPKADVVHGDRVCVPVRASTEDGQTVWRWHLRDRSRRFRLRLLARLDSTARRPHRALTQALRRGSPCPPTQACSRRRERRPFAGRGIERLPGFGAAS
jgi:hypothetical protein